jgi:cytochrome oxidase Cu insertion factor (SCO1/SenC/PrrC family)
VVLRIRWPVWLVVLGVAVVAGVTFAIAHESRAPAAIEFPAAPRIAAAATWPARSRRAPNFQLIDQQGAPISLASLRGQPVVVTFIDPLCRSLCPLEAKVLMRAARRLPPAERPTIVSVSVNPWADTKATFAQDQKHWQLGSSWRWATGSERKLSRVWRDYGVDVRVTSKVVAGVSVRSIAHTEGSYVIDRAGYERALFLYPFNAGDLVKTISSLP